VKKRIDIAALTSVVGTLYPSPFDLPCRARERTKLGDAAGLSQFGVNLLRLPPGAWSSQRHWHTREDEFVCVLSGEVVLVTDGEEEVLRAGDSAGFPAGDTNGHCLQNRSDADARYSKSVPVFPGTRPFIRISTWLHRPVVNPPSTPAGMESPIGTWDAAALEPLCRTGTVID
jgi:uncharacterized cupin superfamily protein